MTDDNVKPQLIRTIETGRALSARVAFLMDGKTLALGYRDPTNPTVAFWNVETSELTKSVSTGRIFLAISPDGRFLITYDRSLYSGSFVVIDLHDERRERSVLAHRSTAHMTFVLGQGEFFADGERFVTTGTVDHTAKVWETGSWHGVFVSFARETIPSAVAGHGTQVVIGFRNGSIENWDFEADKLEGTLKGHGDKVVALAYLEGHKLVSGSLDGTARVWDLTTYKESAVLERFSPGKPVAIAVSPKRALIAVSTGDGAVTLWDMQQRNTRHVLRERLSFVSSLAFSPDGRLLCGVDRHGILNIWAVNEE